jgi:hypothetical protein
LEDFSVMIYWAIKEEDIWDGIIVTFKLNYSPVSKFISDDKNDLSAWGIKHKELHEAKILRG